MKRILSIFLACVLVLGLSLPAYAAAAGSFTDVNNHWAASYIKQVADAGLMTGESADRFSPGKALSRGMFVTILGRLAQVNPEAWKMNYPSKYGSLFSDVDKGKYYAPYINWAARTGITKGVGSGKFKPNTPITREQILTMLKRFADLSGKSFQTTTDAVRFTDDGKISAFAKDSVDALRSTGIIQGIPNADGTCRFDPQASATRAQAAAIFCRMQEVLQDKPDWSETFVTLVMLDETTFSLSTGKNRTLKAQVFPANSTNTTITWLSSDPTVATVDVNGKITWVGKGSCTIYAYSANGCKASCTVSCTKSVPEEEILPESELDVLCFSEPELEWEPEEFFDEPFLQDLSLASAVDTYGEKCTRLFGGSVNEPRTVYTTEAEARENLVELTVPAWDWDENGGKYTRWLTLEVHKDLAATVDQIFREIYDCPAQYPIHSAGGFRFVSWSEHNFGAAIDINPEENFYCDPNGEALVGNYFSPETDEYSIPVGGEIDQIFAKYGFTRGIFWQSGYRDYMHYSFFGT